MFKRLAQIIDQLQEVWMGKSEMEQEEPIIVCFFNLQYAKLRSLELFYNFLLPTLRYNGTRRIGIGHSLCVFATRWERFIELCPKRRNAKVGIGATQRPWQCLHCRRLPKRLHPYMLRKNEKRNDNWGPRLLKWVVRCSKMFCLCSEIYCCYHSWSNKFLFSILGLNSPAFEDSGGSPLAMNWKKLRETRTNIQRSRIPDTES